MYSAHCEREREREREREHTRKKMATKLCTVITIIGCCEGGKSWMTERSVLIFNIH